MYTVSQNSGGTFDIYQMTLEVYQIWSHELLSNRPENLF